MTDQLIKDLEALYALLEPPYAWCKRTLTAPEPRAPTGFAYCLGGGCEKVVMHSVNKESPGERYRKLRHVLSFSLKSRFSSKSFDPLSRDDFAWWRISEFNDAPSTCKRDVLALIRDTIEIS
jgi:hypothetical protein